MRFNCLDLYPIIIIIIIGIFQNQIRDHQLYYLIMRFILIQIKVINFIIFIIVIIANIVIIMIVSIIFMIMY
jgi:hypothetical protein